MPRTGQRKPQKQEIEAIIAEILINDPHSSFRDVDFKLRSDPVWSNRLVEIQDFPKPGTIKNYVSVIRKKLRASGSDRPWSILVSADPQDADYVSAADLPLVLKIWRIRLAHGYELTLRQARWISQLRNLRLWDLATDKGLSALFAAASKYAGRQAAMGGRVDAESSNDSFESHDLDGDLAFRGNIDQFDVCGKNERNALRVAHQAIIDAGQLTRLSVDPESTRETLGSAEVSAKIYDLVENVFDHTKVMANMPFHQRSAFFSVMRLVFQRSDWETLETESRLTLVERILDAVSAEDWNSVADLAEMKVLSVNQNWTGYLEEMLK